MGGSGEEKGRLRNIQGETYESWKGTQGDGVRWSYEKGNDER